MMRVAFNLVGALLVMLPGVGVSAQAFISEYSILHSPAHFDEVTGEQLFKAVCQGCHMSDGQGAVGAGEYPSLANNKKLEASGYPIYVVLEGSGNMPAFKKYMTDEQVLAVVNYIRGHMGNHAEAPATLEEVRAISHR